MVLGDLKSSNIQTTTVQKLTESIINRSYRLDARGPRNVSCSHSHCGNHTFHDVTVTVRYCSRNLYGFICPKDSARTGIQATISAYYVNCIVVFNYQLNYYFLFLNMLFPMGVIGLGNRHIKVYSLEGEPREIRLMSNINWSNFRLKF